MAVNDMGNWDMHDARACGGIGGLCEFCSADCAHIDEQRAEQIKRATRALEVRRDGYESVATS